MTETRNLVEEAPDDGDAHARQALAWVPGYAKEAMDNFVAAVRLEAADAKDSASKGRGYMTAAEQAATRASQALQGAVLAATRSENFASASELAAQKSARETTLAAGHKNEAKTAADGAKASELHVEQMIAEFDPYKNQYGYSRIKRVTGPVYRVTAADVGVTLLFTSPGRVVLPDSNGNPFEPSFFFHVVVQGINIDVLIDHDPGVTLLRKASQTTLVNQGIRMTLQRLDSELWMATDLIDTDEYIADGEIDTGAFVAQSHSIKNLRRNSNNTMAYGMTKRGAKFYAFSIDPIGGRAKSVQLSALKVNDIPDGNVEIIHAGGSGFTGPVCFGVYGGPASLPGLLGWWWGENGLSGNVYPLNITGYSGNDWFIDYFDGYVGTGVKHVVTKLTHRSLKDAQGAAETRWLCLTSTDGFNWFENRFAELNAKVGARRILGNYPEIVLERGHCWVYSPVTDKVSLINYNFTSGKFIETVMSTGFEELVSTHYYNPAAYGLVYRAGDSIWLATDDFSGNNMGFLKVDDCAGYVALTGGVVRGANLVVCHDRAGNGTDWVTELIELSVRVDHPNGIVVRTEYGVPPIRHEKIYCAGRMTIDEGGHVRYVVVNQYGTYNSLAAKAYVDWNEIAMPWADNAILAGGYIDRIPGTLPFRTGDPGGVPFGFYTETGVVWFPFSIASPGGG